MGNITIVNVVKLNQLSGGPTLHPYYFSEASRDGESV